MKVWATKIISEFHNYTQAGKDGVAKRCKALTDAIEGTIIKIMKIFIYCITSVKQKDYTNSKCWYDKIKTEKESIRATATGKKRKETQIWKDFETNYQTDIEV